jgi:hypothetical protein
MDFGEDPFPDKGRLWVIVPVYTETSLHFSALLHDGAPVVSFERAGGSAFN